jgi:hypothetical protein
MVQETILQRRANAVGIFHIDACAAAREGVG